MSVNSSRTTAPTVPRYGGYGWRFASGGYVNAGIEAMARNRSDAAMGRRDHEVGAIRQAITQFPRGEELVWALQAEHNAQQDRQDARCNGFGTDEWDETHRENVRAKKKLVNDLAKKIDAT